MEEWKEYKLGDVSSVSSSKRIFADEYQSEGIPFYRSKEIIEKQKGISIANELYIKESRYNEIKNKFGVPQKGDILLTSVGTLGIPYLVKDEIFYFKDGNITWFYNFKGINNRYLYYWFLSPIAKHYFDIKAIGSTQKALTIETLKKFDIVLPSKSIQQKVADVLKSFDDKIELNNRINANLEEQAQALFRRWFVDFEFPNEQGLPYKSNGGKFVNSELGSIPEGWSVKAIADVAELMAGGDKPCIVTKKPTGECNVPIFSNGMSDDGLYGYTTNAKVFKESVTISARGTIGFVRLRQKPFFPIVRLITAIPNTSLISAKYLYFLLLDKNISGTGTTQQQLTVPDFRRYELIVPTLNIIKNFNNITNVVFNKITFLKHENEILESLRDAILPKLMNNELRP
ncbi:MAG: restriction endonuclease subunit S [Prevotella sp.]|nr:restriction endonuclease subunit S [Prevotella sp.]